MTDDDLDLRGFSGVCRLFPLPDVVLFPHSVLPLHIFERRYRQMTEDALDGDRLVTIVQLHRGEGPAAVRGFAPPALHEVACVGRIIQHERLPDGRFNFLLLGKKRVRLKREISGPKLYRMAEVEVLEDTPAEDAEQSLRTELIAAFRTLFETSRGLDPDLSQLLQSEMPLSALTDILAHAVGLPGAIRQSLLAELRADRRAGELVQLLRRLERDQSASASPPPLFPPPFSAN